MNLFPKLKCLSALLVLVGLWSCQSTETLELRLLHSTDVHSNIFAYDYVGDKPDTGGMARLSSFLQEARGKGSDLLLLDAGDMLQGTPVAYYSNYIDTLRPHAVLEAMNLLGYDVATIGNHDIEAGHRVYDRFVREAKFAVLGANVLSTETGEPYFTPYKVFERGGMRVAVLGLTTPAVPQWLPEHLWQGMRFVDIIESAEEWVPRILREEKPDLLVALIHSGLENDNSDYLENAGIELAKQIEGIDLVLLGHDHRETNKWIKRGVQDSVLVVNPANHLDKLSDIRVKIKKQGGKVISKELQADFLDLNAYEPDTAFLTKLNAYDEGVRTFLAKRVGILDAPVVAREALFGSSAFLNVVHQMQLEVAGADISFAAPLSLTAELPAGDIYVRDLFKWFPFSNSLFAMELTGREIKGYLEHSYAGWANQMKSDQDHLLALRPDYKPEDKYKTLVPTFNYSSAEGVSYHVNVQQPAGKRLAWIELANGQPLEDDKTYLCAINSYRAGGAGGMLTLGAGIPKEQLKGRIRWQSGFDEFYLMMQYFERHGIVRAKNPDNWRFLPTAYQRAGAERSRQLLFPKQSSHSK